MNSFFDHQRAKIGPTFPKSETFLNTHPTCAHHKFELDCVNTFSDNGWKPPFWHIFNHFLSTRGPIKIGPTSPKSESVLNTDPTNAYTKFEMNWAITFPDNGRKSRTDRRTNTRTDPHHSYVPSQLRRRGQKGVTDRQTDRQTDRRTDREMDGQTEALRRITLIWSEPVQWLLCYGIIKVQDGENDWKWRQLHSSPFSHWKVQGTMKGPNLDGFLPPYSCINRVYTGIAGSHHDWLCIMLVINTHILFSKTVLKLLFPGLLWTQLSWLGNHCRALISILYRL